MSECLNVHMSHLSHMSQAGVYKIHMCLEWVHVVVPTLLFCQLVIFIIRTGTHITVNFDYSTQYPRMPPDLALATLI